MSLLIKGIDKVAFCIDCPCAHVDNSGVGRFNGKLMCKGQYWVPIYNKGVARHEIKECPITEIPKPHGRLIDADAHIQSLKENQCGERCRKNHDCVNCGIGMYIRIVENEPTLIEAEE